MVCRNCGKEIAEGVKFCRNCGQKQEAVQNAAVRQTGKVENTAKFCRNCGRQVSAGARFCRSCGYQYDTEAADTQANALQNKASRAGNRNGSSVKMRYPAAQAQPIQQSVRQSVQQPLRQAVQQAVRQPLQQAVQQAVPQQLQQALGGMQGIIASPSGTGEFALDLGGQVAGLASGQASALQGAAGKIAGPIATLFGGAGSWFTGIFKIFKDRRALLFTVVLGGLWILLEIFQSAGIETPLTDILSKLTFAEGGTSGDTAGVIGGFFGKSIVGAGYCSLLYGGIPKLSKGIKTIFTEKKGFNPGSFLLGFSGAGAVYAFCTGDAEGGFMVGVLGAVMSVQALSQKNGFISSMAASLSAKTLPDKTKILNAGQYKGILTGAAAGFAASPVVMTAVGASAGWYLVLLLLAAAGLVVMQATKGKGVQQ